MAFLERGSVKLHYEIHGDMGSFIVLTHGFSATSQMWRGQIDVLSRDHRLVLWDMRGHGRSDYPDDPSEYSEKATVEDIAALLDAVGTKKAIVGGLSLGGYMSLAFYSAYPDRVTALLIIDTGPGFRNAGKSDERASLISRPRQRRPRHAHSKECECDQFSAWNRGAVAGDRRRKRRAVPQRCRLYGQAYSRCSKDGHSRRRPRVQY